MCFFFVFLLYGAVKCEEPEPVEDDDEAFWKSLEENDENQEIEIIENPQIITYDKARFNLPIQRRLNSLFPDVAKAVRDLQGISRMEFIYEEKFPTLSFLDSQDVVVEKFEIGKKSKDEIKAMLTMRGFDLNLRVEDIKKAQQQALNETATNNTASEQGINETTKTETNENTAEERTETIQEESKIESEKSNGDVQIEEPYPEEQTVDYVPENQPQNKEL